MIDHIYLPVSNLERSNEFYKMALAPLGVTHIDMPATPERVWRAIQEQTSP